MAQEKDNLLRKKLLQMHLQEQHATFIIENGHKFIDSHEILAKRLEIDVKLAEKSLVELKAHKEKQFSLELERFKQLVKENPDAKDLKELALLNDVDDCVVSEHLVSLKSKKLTEFQRIKAIKENFNAGFSIAEIAEELDTSLEYIKERVEENCITFNGTEGQRTLEIIYRNFERQPISKLREMIINKNVKLQEKLCCDLAENNPKEYGDVERYFSKFEESQNFFDKNVSILSIEDKTCIRTSCLEDIEQLSIKLNKVKRVIRNFFLQYSPDEILMQHHAKIQFQQIQILHSTYGLDSLISHIIYRMIILNSSKEMMENAQESPRRVFEELLPLAFYYLKCSLSLEEFTHIINKLTGMSHTTLDIFHLIFQMSDPVVKGLCIEHYSFSNPVPFYYPILNSHILNVKQKLSLKKQRKICQFDICKELWFSIQQFNGLVSFGLGWASWNPMGKSHLLDLMFKTDFVNGSPQTSPFHLNSIDIQMTRNLFGKKDGKSNESTQWAYIDCHACSDTNVIRDICQNVDIVLVHVSYFDYNQNTDHFEKELQTIAATTKHVYVLVRDCPESELMIEQASEYHEPTTQTIVYTFLPNLVKPTVKVSLSLKDLGYRILHSNNDNPKLVMNSLIENLTRQFSVWNKLNKERELIEKIINYINFECKQGESQNEFSFLSYYPHFVKYMLCFYKALDEQDQKNIIKLNEECKQLANILEHTEMNSIVKDFNKILGKENSTLILWKLSQELNKLSKQFSANTPVYTIEILWREAVLSSKYHANNKFIDKFSKRFSNYVKRGEPFELIDGDNLRFFNQDISALLSPLYKTLNGGLKFVNKKRSPIVISIFGPQSSGKSTLLNYCFGCKFLTSAGRCTKGVYASLSKLSRPINHSEHFLILDTEGLDAIERGKTLQDTSCINFDRTMVLFCLAVSQAIIINVKGDIGEEMRNLLQICAYSLNKLKVSKVAAPKIFFVLNQQADPDPEKHLNSINTLLEKLNKESYLMETEGAKISDLIQVSVENLFVLPSAFNSEPMNTQLNKLFDSDIFKLSPTVSFANKCADLRMSIINQLDVTQDAKTPFNSMSEWMEMSGVIWDTIIKYQDIVKYRNTEELKCSISLRKIVNDLMTNTICRNKEEYQNITEQIILSINEFTKWNPPNMILEDVKKGLDEVFNEYQERALTDFTKKCLSDPLLKRMEYMCDESKSNLNRLIYMEKKIYEDKLKDAIKAKLIEIKHKESMMMFQQDIEKNSDAYIELPIERQKEEFEKIWVGCFRNENKGEEDAEYDEKFENLYSVFMVESKTMEKKQVVYTQFRQSEFNMDKIVQELEREMLLKFCGKGAEFIYPWRENRVPIKEMTPYLGNRTCQYLNSLFLREDKKYQRNSKNLKFSNWVPSECYPLVRYCSGYYNHPDIIWNTEKSEQILLLASKLKDLDNSNRSTWEKLINDLKVGVEDFIMKDPNISHSTVKEIVNLLCNICKVVNYEINYIEAKLTNASERTISTFAFALAFKSILEAKIGKEKENESKQKKVREKNFEYFLQKVENLKLARGNWDRTEMRKGDRKISNNFAEDFLAAVVREVNTICKQTINEEYFNKEKENLSHTGMQLLANNKLTQEIHNPSTFVDESNFVVQLICNRKECLKSLFRQEWCKVASNLYDRIVGNMEKLFNKEIAIVKNVIEEFLKRLSTMCEEKQRLGEIGTDSDSSFEVVDQTATEESNINPKTRVIPLKAMVLFLKMYLDARVSREDFNQFFNNVFEIDDVKVRKHPQTYVLFEKPNSQEHILDEETFKKLSNTNMFVSTETIFNISIYLTQFLTTLKAFKFSVNEGEYENLLKASKEKFEANVINCPHQCPSCGKFCEKELHPNGARCQIMTGHQLCSMGGNAWNTNKDRTAVLLMCEDYKDYSPVLIPGQNMTWGEFKDKFSNVWDWDLPTDPKYIDLQKENHETIKEIWKIFGKEILAYYRNRGTHISYIPYTSPEEIYESLFSPVYYVCFVVDGTDLMGSDLKHAKRWVSEAMKDSDVYTSNFKVIVYHGHAVKRKKCIEMFPDNSEFTSDKKSIESFLKPIKNYGKRKI